jgi:hypothetical protein
VDASIARRVKFDEYGASIAGLVFRGLIGRETAGQRMQLYPIFRPLVAACLQG